MSETPRVLIAHPHREEQRRVADALLREGFSVVLEGDALEASQSLLRHAFDAVVLSTSLRPPEGTPDRASVATQLRSTQHGAHIPLVFISDWEDSESAAELRDCFGALGCLSE